MAHVLIVDDDEGVRFTVRSCLEAEGHEVEEASDGASGLQRLITAEIDLVLLDIMMPGPDGFATLQAIRRRSPTPDVPVIILSAKSRETSFVNAFRAGADGYLTKPFELEELLGEVQSVLARSPSERAKAREAGLARAELLAQLELLD